MSAYTGSATNAPQGNSAITSNTNVSQKDICKHPSNIPPTPTELIPPHIANRFIADNSKIPSTINRAAQQRWGNHAPATPLSEAAWKQIEFTTADIEVEKMNAKVFKESPPSIEEAKNDFIKQTKRDTALGIKDIHEAVREYAQTRTGRKVLSRLTAKPNQHLTIQYNPAHNSAEVRPLGGMQLTYGPNAQSKLRMLAHELGHTEIGGSYTDFDGNVQSSENLLLDELGIPLRDAYKNEDGKIYSTAGCSNNPLPK